MLLPLLELPQLVLLLLHLLHLLLLELQLVLLLLLLLEVVLELEVLVMLLLLVPVLLLLLALLALLVLLVLLLLVSSSTDPGHSLTEGGLKPLLRGPLCELLLREHCGLRGGLTVRPCRLARKKRCARHRECRVTGAARRGRGDPARRRPLQQQLEVLVMLRLLLLLQRAEGRRLSPRPGCALAQMRGRLVAGARWALRDRRPVRTGREAASSGEGVVGDRGDRGGSDGGGDLD